MVYVFDNILSPEEFWDYKNRVSFARFSDIMSQGIKYSDISQDVSTEKLYRSIDNLLTFKTKDVLSFLRAYRNKPDYRHPSWIHSDALFADYIGVYFVQPSEFPQDDGLSLWKNKTLNSIEMLSTDVNSEISAMVDRDTLDPEKWELWQRIEFKENRMIICPANYFHSTTTYGHIGGELDNCRIVHVLFFNKDQNDQVI